jgi:hypothetical protein
MKRWVSLAAAGLMCGGVMLGVPGIAGAATSAPSAQAVQPGGRMIRVPGNASSSPTISLNWSGYAAVSKTPFTSVGSTFVQPAAKCPGIPLQLTSNWVGLDGFNTGTVEQDGTSIQCGGKNHTTPIYKAWIEMFPKPSVNVFTVKPGDTMHASVHFKGGKFTLTITDRTSGKSHTTTAPCADCKRASAEWIIERPAFCANKTCTKAILAELANFRSSTMSGATASVAGGAVRNAGSFHNFPINMINGLKRGFISLDTVGSLSGRSFTATWDRHGTTVPLTLGPNG